MTIQALVTLITLFSVITGLVTEAIKKLLDSFKLHYSTNLLAFVVACIVGACGTTFYCVLQNIPFTSVNVTTIVLMSLASSVGSMVGYDKVIQTIEQIAGKK